MEKTISAAEANRKFSALLRGVREGHSYLVTSHGKPVAEIRAPREPSGAEEARRRKAWAALKKQLEAQTVLNLPHISRDEMYED